MKLILHALNKMEYNVRILYYYSFYRFEGATNLIKNVKDMESVRKCVCKAI